MVKTRRRNRIVAVTKRQTKWYLKDFIVEHLESFLTCQETCLQKRCWPTIGGLPFSYIIKIFKIFSKAHNDSLPELLSNDIYKERRNGYSLRGGDCLSVPRFETRFMKDSLAYRGIVLWNTICHKENGISHLNNEDRNLIRTKDYFKDFKFDATSASTTRHRNADFMYNW